MIEVLRDPVWQFIGVTVSLIAFIAPTIKKYYKKRKGGLSYSILEKNLIIRKERRSKTNVNLFHYSNKLYKININIYNSSNRPITRSDFDSPIKLVFNGNMKITQYEIIKTFPENLDIKIDCYENQIIIYPTLINPNDEFIIQLSINCDNKFELISIKPTCRIKGLSEIRYEKNQSMKAENIISCIGLVGSIISILLYIIDISIPDVIKGTISTTYLIVLLIGFIVLIMKDYYK